MSALPQKNGLIQLDITGMTSEGSGIGRAEEMAVFVPATAVGDRILCRIVKVEKRFAYGRVEELITPSPDRLPTADCPVAAPCGGCTFRHVTYEAELRYKWQRVADALQRIGGIDITPRPIVSGASDRYRNKAQYPMGRGEEGLIFGFYAPRSHRLVPCRDCLLQPAEFKDILNAIDGWAKKAGVTVYDETARTGLLRHVYIRKAQATGQIMVCLVCTGGRIPMAGELTEKLKGIPGVCSVVVNLNRRDTNVVLGEEEFPLLGEPAITDRLGGLEFSLSPRSFYQVNHDMAEKLYALAAEAAGLTGNETLLDLYCGTGTIGLTMARAAKQLIGVEVVAPAVEDARRNAARNGIENARFICADAGEAAKQLAAEGIRPDAVILDPPRKGCDPAVIRTVAEMAPARVVYVSCDPATLARDLKLFRELGYETKTVTPVDMFPRTAHVETVVRLSRQ